jgi:putative flippase GtrA
MTKQRNAVETRRPTSTTQRLWRFALVGASGTILNTVVLVIMHQSAHLPLLVASAVAVEISILYNFIWNNRWTFGQNTWSFQRLARFNMVSLGGLSVTSATLWALVTYGDIPYVVANLAGIGCATVWNFVINSLWTWNTAASNR